MTPPLLEADALVKRFGSTVALQRVDLVVRAGSVHALLGENGAGKSTFAKIVAGLEQPTEGTLRVDGAAVRLAGRRDARRAGVGYVAQSLGLVSALTLVENALLGGSGVRADTVRMRADLEETARRSGLHIDLDVATGRLPLADRQLGELLIALAAGARLLLLDEPTSSLGPVEIDRLLGQVRQLAETGVGVVLITHRLGEVMQVADEVTVLRAGRRVHTGTATATSAARLADLMVGERPPAAPRARRPLGTRRLEVRDLSAHEGGSRVEDITLDVAGGEIVGVAGVAGSGQRALADALAGLANIDAGAVTVDASEVTGDPAAATRAGLAYVPEERTDGLVPELSLADNSVLLRLGERRFAWHGFRRRGAAARFARELCDRFDVRPPVPELASGQLSGGNQQKLLVGRELERGPAVVIAHGPAQGLDIRAAAAVRDDIEAAAADGAAVVLVSAELDEILALADRVVVLHAGRLVDELDAREVDIARLGRAMAGIAGTDNQEEPV